jgi:hypothetical protein
MLICICKFHESASFWSFVVHCCPEYTFVSLHKKTPCTRLCGLVVRVPGYRSEVRFWFPALPDFLRSCGLEWGPFILVSTNEELFERNSCGSGPESRECGRKDPSRCPRGTLYLQKLALSSLTSSGRSVGIVRSRTQATEYIFVFGRCSQTRRTLSSIGDCRYVLSFFFV